MFINQALNLPLTLSGFVAWASLEITLIVHHLAVKAVFLDGVEQGGMTEVFTFIVDDQPMMIFMIKPGADDASFILKFRHEP